MLKNFLCTSDELSAAFCQLCSVRFSIADQHILIGANEGLYTLNLNEIHENTMELVS